MTTNPVRSAVELVDAEPSSEFLSTLRAQLLSDDIETRGETAQQLRGSTSLNGREFVMLTPISRTRSNRRVYKVLLASAACVVVLAATLVVKQSNDHESGLRDVDPGEALSLGQAARIAAESLGTGWQQVDDFRLSDYAEQTAAVNAEVPECAQLASAGLAQPTNKSVMLHQDFANGPVPMFHDVWVFATSDDASRAMDVVASEIYPTCWFKLFDRFTALNRNVTAVSISTGWRQEVSIATHGDRQVIFGQKIDYTFPVRSASAGAINAYVQVGRAIAFVDPQYFSDVSATSNVEQAITASTNALERVFGS